MSDDYGTAVHYLAVTRGTTVYDSAGEAVGKVRKVKDNANEHILDGFEIEDATGATLFVDAPEVARTFENAVTLSITAAELPKMSETLGKTPSIPLAPPAGGFLSKLFRR